MNKYIKLCVVFLCMFAFYQSCLANEQAEENCTCAECVFKDPESSICSLELGKCSKCHPKPPKKREWKAFMSFKNGLHKYVTSRLYLRLNFARYNYENIPTTTVKPEKRSLVAFGAGYKIPQFPYRIEYLKSHNSFITKNRLLNLRGQTEARMFNLYRDFSFSNKNSLFKRLNFYLMVGAGRKAIYKNVSMSKTMPNNRNPPPKIVSKSWGPCYALGTGFQFKLDEVFSLDFGIKYLQLGKIKGVRNTEHKIKALSSSVSIIFNLW